MSNGEDLACLLEQYNAAKREQLDAWAAVNDKLSAMSSDASIEPPTNAELLRLRRARVRRDDVEERLTALMAGELEVWSPARSEPQPECAEDVVMGAQARGAMAAIQSQTTARLLQSAS